MTNPQLSSNQALLSAAGVDVSHLNQGIIGSRFLPASQTANTFPIATIATNMPLNQNVLPPQVNSQLSLPPPNINREVFVAPNQPNIGTIVLPNGTIINQNMAAAAAAAANYVQYQAAAYWQSMNTIDPINNTVPAQIQQEIRQDVRSFHPNEIIEENNHKEKEWYQNWREDSYPPNNREECHRNQNLRQANLDDQNWRPDFHKEPNWGGNYYKEPNWRENHHKNQGWREERDFDRDHVDSKLNRQYIKERNNRPPPPRPAIEYPLSRCLPSCEEIPDATARLTETIRLWWIDNE